MAVQPVQIDSTAPRGLTPPQKAAVVFRMLGAIGITLPPGALSEAETRTLAREMEGLGGVDPATLAAVVDEFLGRLGGAPAGVPALPPLPGLPPLPEIGAPATAAVDPPARDATGHDGWEVVISRDNETLLGILEAEAPEVGAVLMSKLKVSRAAEILGIMPGPRARRITYAISLITGISPETVARIGDALAAQFEVEPARAFEDGPVEKVGAILNFSRALTRNDMLEGLHETDPEFAEAVRKSIFTFANIPARIGPRDIPKIVRQVDQAELVRALAAAQGDADLEKAAEFILGAMSQRMAETLRGEITEIGEVKDTDGEAAMSAVVAVIRQMEEAGEIYLVAEDE